VSAPAFIGDLNLRFVGEKLDDKAFNEIQAIVLHHHCILNVMDPVFNTTNIDNEDNRVNVRTDANFMIKSFTIG
jgi:hypothetical protein